MEEAQQFTDLVKMIGQAFTWIGGFITGHPFEIAVLGYVTIRNRKFLGKILKITNSQKSQHDAAQDEEIEEIDQQVWKISHTLYGDKDTGERGLIQRLLKFEKKVETELEEIKQIALENKNKFEEHTKNHKGIREEAISEALKAVNKRLKEKGM